MAARENIILRPGYLSDADTMQYRKYLFLHVKLQTSVNVISNNKCSDKFIKRKVSFYNVLQI